jgi:hypothetical protein
MNDQLIKKTSGEIQSVVESGKLYMLLAAVICVCTVLNGHPCVECNLFRYTEHYAIYIT